jgi:nucleoside-diphosphate-sugar epimerase
MESQAANYQIVVTGASGYLGSSLVRTLKGLGYKVIGIDLVASDINLDLSQPNLNIQERINSDFLLIHLASRLPGTVPGDQLAKESKIIIENLVRNFTPSRTLFMSSTAVYALEAKNHFADVRPWEIYGETKLQAENDLRKNFDRVSILRSGTLFDRNRGGAISKIISRGQEGKIVFLPNHGENHHPFTSTLDVVNFICEWVTDKNNSNRIYDIVSPNALTFREIFELKGKSPIIGNVSSKVLSRLGSDRYPLMGISAWHLNALNYNLTNFENLPQEIKLTSTKELFQSI